MITGGYVVGAEALIRNLKQHPERIRRAVDSVLKQEARAMCVAYAYQTEPMGADNFMAEVQFGERIEKEVRKVFASRQNPGRVYQLLRKLRPDLAPAYWHAYKARKTRVMGQILNQAGLPTGINPAALKAARTGPKGRVAKGTEPVSLATEPQVRAFARGQKRLIGTAKAGWYAAARSLGGRVRAPIAQNAKRNERRFAGLGGSRFETGRCEIFTNVAHAKNALPPRKYLAATARGRRSFAAALQKAIREVNASFGKSTGNIAA